MPPSSLKKEDIIIICNEYSSGRKNSTELASDYNVNSETIRRWLKKNNIKMRESRDSLRDPVNEFYFSIIDKPEKAYWLGFLAADVCLAESAGSTRAFRFFLANKDRHAVNDLAKDMRYEGQLYEYLKKGQTGIVFNSPQLCNDLIKLGLVRWKKKDDPTLFANIPDIYKKDFIRGFFDGDGSIGCNANSKKPTKQYYIDFCADKLHTKTQNMIEDYLVQQLGFKKKQVKIRTDHSSITWNGNNQIEKFGDWLYDNHNRKLNRKYAHFLAVKSRDFLGYWQTFHKWEFKYDVRELKLSKSEQELEDIIDRFTEIVRHGFEPLYYHSNDRKILQDELYDLEEYDVNKVIEDDAIKASQNIGQNIIFHHQPAIWGVGPRKSKTFLNLVEQKSTCRRAIKAMLTSGEKIYPTRLRRELEFAGVSRASLLAVPTIMAVIEKFGLTGKWFDPCAGWGTRLLAAYVLGLPYEGTDPAVQYYGLNRLKDWLQDTNAINSQRVNRNNITLHNKTFQELEFPNNASFLFTSPPFYDKEDYGLKEIAQTFEEWYQNFMIKLIVKAKESKMRIVLHIDQAITERLEQDYELTKIKHLTGNRSKAPNEWFVEIK